MKDSTLYIIAAAVYFVILAAFIAVYLSTKDAGAIAMAGTAASSVLVVLTVVFAYLIMKKSPSDRYREKYLDGKDDEGRKKE